MFPRRKKKLIIRKLSNNALVSFIAVSENFIISVHFILFLFLILYTFHIM